MCGDDPAKPNINKDDVSKDKDNALPDGIAPSDGAESLTAVGLKPRLLEAFQGRTFEDVWSDVSGIGRDAAPSRLDEVWREVGEQLHTSVLAFEREVKLLKESGDWEGKTIEAAFTNAVESTTEPFYTGTAALRGAELVHKFRDTFNYVHDNLVRDPLGEFDTMWDRYVFDRDHKEQPIESAPGQQSYYLQGTTEAEKAEVRRYYNEYMRLVMNDSYKPGVTDIYDNYPQFTQSTAAAEPVDIPGLPDKPGQPTHESGGGNTTGSGGFSPSSFGGGGGGGVGSGMRLGSPSPPKLSLPSPPNGLDPTRLPQPVGRTPTPGPPAGPSLTDPAKAAGAASGLANGASQAMGAATKAAQAAKPPGGPGSPGAKKPPMPEGALNLGKGKPGAGTGAGGAGKGGAGLGGAPKGLSQLPGLAAAATAADAAGAARPGAGAGAPAMGPPGTPGGAGHGAGGQQNKEHKVNKALRGRRTGTQIAGEAEAVVPVIGADPDTAGAPGSTESRGPTGAMEEQHQEQVIQRSGSEADPRRRPQMRTAGG